MGVPFEPGGVANLEDCNIYQNGAVEGPGPKDSRWETTGGGVQIYYGGEATMMNTNVYENIANSVCWPHAPHAVALC